MTFPLIGNERLENAISSMISSERIPHAILIEGDNGLGKHTLAGYISMAAVCSEAEKPCGECRNCHLADIKTHPDISFTAPEDKKKNISVSQIRALRDDTFVKPHMADHRVFIIEKADTMNEQSQNALLKVLEEPPEGVIFILLAESKSALLETIISRCVVLTLSAPESKIAFEYLKGASKADNDAINTALESTKCNIGKAVRLLSKRTDKKSDTAAREFLKLAFCGSEYEMLKLLIPFEKDRVAVDDFFKELKYLTAAELKNSYNDVLRSASLLKLYDAFSGFERNLKTNINLSLLFCAAVCKVKQIVTQ